MIRPLLPLLALCLAACAPAAPLAAPTSASAAAPGAPNAVPSPAATAAPTGLAAAPDGAAPDDPTLQAAFGGKAAPAIAFLDTTGKPRTLADYQGKTVLLTFFAYWCPHCQAEVPRLQAEIAKRNAPTLAFVPVEGSAGKLADVQSFIHDFAITVPTFYDPSGAARRAFEVDGYPTTFRVGPDGKVLDAYVGELPTGDYDRYMGAAPR